MSIRQSHGLNNGDVRFLVVVMTCTGAAGSAVACLVAGMFVARSIHALKFICAK